MPQVDLLTHLASIFDLAQHCEEKDPLLLGIDVSEDSSGKEDSSPPLETPTQSSGEDMEGVVETRHGKKRDWEGRWESAEDRDEEKQSERTQEEEEGSPKEGREGRQAIEESKRLLRRDVRRLESTVEANQQIELQERMQLLQDKEHEAVRAAMEVEANIRGQEPVRVEPSPINRPPPNPRLNLAAARRQADAASESGASGEEGWERAGKGGRKKGKGRRRRSASRSTSRTPRGKGCGQDTMD